MLSGLFFNSSTAAAAGLRASEATASDLD
uniref:Uncharacterized protein n=1 Tax=Anguilla anguilla TaxID=7936 RepID=A0A0E9VCK8_ANGAN